MIWLIALSIAYDHTDKVYRCHDELVELEEKTPDGHRIFKLIRTDCRWVDFDPPYIEPEKGFKWEDIDFESETG